MNKIAYAFKGLISEEVQNVDVASGVKCVWNVLFVVLETFYFDFSLRPTQVPVPGVLSKCSVQTRIQK